jgi:hypothetical protein
MWQRFSNSPALAVSGTPGKLSLRNVMQTTEPLVFVLLEAAVYEQSLAGEPVVH